MPVAVAFAAATGIFFLWHFFLTTVYVFFFSSAINYKAWLQGYQIKQQWRDGVGKWLTGVKKIEAKARKDGKKKSQIGLLQYFLNKNKKNIIK